MPKIVGYDQAVMKRITCRNCGAINEYAPSDVRVLYKGRDISQTMCTTEGFNCGGCGKELITRSD